MNVHRIGKDALPHLQPSFLIIQESLTMTDKGGTAQTSLAGCMRLWSVGINDWLSLARG
jgi:hypothetical protein